MHVLVHHDPIVYNRTVMKKGTVCDTSNVTDYILHGKGDEYLKNAQMAVNI